MLTRMKEDDCGLVLQVFNACRTRRDYRERNDRKFLEALHYFTLHNITWRALPAEFGNWNSVRKRFWRLSQKDILIAFFEALVNISQTKGLVNMFDSTVIRAHVSAAGAKGGQDGQAVGRSRSGFSSKIHLKTDFDGYPIALHLNGREASDSRNFEVLLDIGPDGTLCATMADKDYDAKANRAAVRECSIVPVISHRSNTAKRAKFFAKVLYKARAWIEQRIRNMKRFKKGGSAM